MIIQMFDYVSDFGGNKDTAKQLRVEKIMPAISKGKKVVLDFADVNGVTQSFVHALIAEAIREFPEKVFELVEFRHCTRDVQVVVEIVAEYMQEGSD